jgi:hypothetical protein
VGLVLAHGGNSAEAPSIIPATNAQSMGSGRKHCHECGLELRTVAVIRTLSARFLLGVSSEQDKLT